jgi:hypothetical protein
LLSQVATVAALTQFHPVPVRLRSDGWSGNKQRMFIETLADTGSVAQADEAAGMSLASAYPLRRRSGAEDFAAAWTCAQYYSVNIWWIPLMSAPFTAPCSRCFKRTNR